MCIRQSDRFFVHVFVYLIVCLLVLVVLRMVTKQCGQKIGHCVQWGKGGTEHTLGRITRQEEIREVCFNV